VAHAIELAVDGPDKVSLDHCQDRLHRRKRQQQQHD